MSYSPRLKDKYSNEIVPALKEKFKYKSIMEVPMVEKIVISQGVGEAVADKKLIENAVNDLSEIAGQKALIVNSKKVLLNAINKGGSSIRDFKNALGKKGDFQRDFKVYEREGLSCKKYKCKGFIKRKVISNRSTFFCNSCQK